MNPTIYEVTQIGAGRLFIMPCPDADHLKDDLIYFRTRGVRAVASLLETREAESCGLEHEAALCKQVGLSFTHFPIRDRRVPTDEKAFQALVNQLYHSLYEGENLAIHCYAGIGRTGVLAACLMIKDGMTPQDAVDLLSEVRGHNMPQTQEQYDFLMDYQPDAEAKAPRPPGFWRRLFA